MYKFSIPMPYSKENIDKLIGINKQIEKSKIDSLFFALPLTCELYTGFEQPRNNMTKHSNFVFWSELMSYAIEKGFDIIYNFNILDVINKHNPNIVKQFEKLDKILDELIKIGVKKLRICNIQLLEYISNKYPYFDLYVSTVNNYNNIWQFKNLKTLYPNIKQIVPSQDINKNFKLLSNIKNELDIDVEIMCNEGCLRGCINFNSHHGIKNYNDNFTAQIIDSCARMENQYPFEYLCSCNHVFPWDIKEYSKIGINKFKLTGRDAICNFNENYGDRMIEFYKNYMLGIDNIKYLSNFPLILFLSNARIKPQLKNLTGKDIIKFMPDIKYFRKYGHLCSSRCGLECKYCYKCAEKIQKVYEKKIKDMKKQLHYVPACKISPC